MTDDAKDTSSATWKFDFEDTVNADPVAKGACLKILRVFLNFANKSDPRAFCSLADLMLLTGCTRPTVKRAIKTMVRLKYFEPLFVTEGGSTMYKLVNVRKQLIDDHIAIAKTSLALDRADRKKRERSAKRGKEICPPNDQSGEKNFPPKVKESFPNTVELNRRDSCSEGNDISLTDHTPSNPYASASDDDPTVPFDIPVNDNEAEDILGQLGNVNPLILRHLRMMLMAGELTPALLHANLSGGVGA